MKAEAQTKPHTLTKAGQKKAVHHTHAENIRRELNSLMQEYGFAPVQSYQTVPVSYKLSVANTPGANGMMSWDGAISVSPRTITRAKRGLQKVVSGADDYVAFQDDVHGISTFVHEAVHSFAMAGEHYTSTVGMITEEVSTELIARRIMVQTLGRDGRGAWAEGMIEGKLTYGKAINAVTDNFRTYLGQQGVHVSRREAMDLLTDAAIRARQATAEIAVGPDWHAMNLTKNIKPPPGATIGEDAWEFIIGTIKDPP